MNVSKIISLRPDQQTELSKVLHIVLKVLFIL
jgi:hypothetical protein